MGASISPILNQTRRQKPTSQHFHLGATVIYREPRIGTTYWSRFNQSVLWSRSSVAPRVPQGGRKGEGGTRFPLPGHTCGRPVRVSVSVSTPHRPVRRPRGRSRTVRVSVPGGVRTGPRPSVQNRRLVASPNTPSNYFSGQ